MGIKAYINIIRPINCIFASITPLIGLFNASKPNLSSLFSNSENYILIFGGYLTYFFIAGASNVINDYYDLEIDKINKPNRPLPKGDIKPKQAMIYYWILIVISIILSIITALFSVNLIIIPLIALFFILVGYIYGWKGKRSGFLGNIMVGVSFSSGIPFGALLIKDIVEISWEIWLFFFTSMFLLISREIVKGMEDLEGDSKFNIKTIANTIGIKIASIMSISFSLSAIITFIIPFLITGFTVFYILFVIMGLIAVILSIIVLLGNYKNKKYQSASSLLLKIGAYCGIIAYTVALI